MFPPPQFQPVGILLPLNSFQILAILNTVVFIAFGLTSISHYSYKTRSVTNFVKVFAPFALAGLQLLLYFPPVVAIVVCVAGLILTLIDVARDRLRA